MDGILPGRYLRACAFPLCFLPRFVTGRPNWQKARTAGQLVGQSHYHSSFFLSDAIPKMS